MKIAIDTHDKPALAKAALEVLRPLVGEHYNYGPVSKHPMRWIQTAPDGSKIGLWHGGDLVTTDMFTGTKVIDAYTEFGKLVELLEAPPEIIIKGVGSHDAVVKSDKSGVQIGCQFASKATVRQVLDALNQSRLVPEFIRVNGVKNPTLRKIILSLGGIETDAYWHPDFASIVLQNGRYRTQDCDKPQHHLSATVVDARTDMGKLIELLEGKKETEIQFHLRDRNGKSNLVTSRITENKITVAGETIPKEKVREIWNALQD